MGNSNKKPVSKEPTEKTSPNTKQIKSKHTNKYRNNNEEKKQLANEKNEPRVLNKKICDDVKLEHKVILKSDIKGANYRHFVNVGVLTLYECTDEERKNCQHKMICSGTLLNSGMVYTAAHCLGQFIATKDGHFAFDILRRHTDAILHDINRSKPPYLRGLFFCPIAGGSACKKVQQFYVFNGYLNPILKMKNPLSHDQAKQFLHVTKLRIFISMVQRNPNWKNVPSVVEEVKKRIDEMNEIENKYPDSKSYRKYFDGARNLKLDKIRHDIFDYDVAILVLKVRPPYRSTFGVAVTGIRSASLPQQTKLILSDPEKFRQSDLSKKETENYFVLAGYPGRAAGITNAELWVWEWRSSEKTDKFIKCLKFEKDVFKSTEKILVIPYGTGSGVSGGPLLFAENSQGPYHVAGVVSNGNIDENDETDLDHTAIVFITREMDDVLAKIGTQDFLQWRAEKINSHYGVYQYRWDNKHGKYVRNKQTKESKQQISKAIQYLPSDSMQMSLYDQRQHIAAGQVDGAFGYYYGLENELLLTNLLVIMVCVFFISCCLLFGCIAGRTIAQLTKEKKKEELEVEQV